MDKNETIQETKKHIEAVKQLLSQVIKMLELRGEYHDSSKLEEPELSVFAEYTPKLKTLTYGSDEYKECLGNMQEALSHHYSHNRHHPEYYENCVGVCDKCGREVELFTDGEKCQRLVLTHIGKNFDNSKVCDGIIVKRFTLRSMTIVDIVEMFCDWVAATRRHADGDIMKSIEHNKTRFNISEDITCIFRNTALLFENIKL